MSQERVLTLLYDKTFPPRPATSSGANPLGINKSMGRLDLNEDMRQFNYYGQTANIEEFTEEDALRLEREVEELLRNRVTSAHREAVPQGIVNIKGGGDFRLTKSAHVGKRQNLMMNAAYGQQPQRFRQTHGDFEMGGQNVGQAEGHIYEDYREDEDQE